MKTLVALIVVLSIIAGVSWQNRVNLLVWALPKINEIRNPIGANVPTEWTKGPAATTASPNERPPNIILILADDMGFNDVSLYNGGAGNGALITPNIDAIAQQGVAFSNGYAANAVCAPSRASILTGRYSTRFGFEFTPFPKVGATIFQWMQELDQPVLPAEIDMSLVKTMPDMTYLGMPPEEITIAEVLKNAGYYTAHIGKWHLGSVNGMRPED